VWNYCNGAQVHALDHNAKWPSEGQLKSLIAGASKDLGIPAQTVQGVCEEYIDRRRGSKKAKLRWRGKRSLGWLPFKNQTIVLADDVVRFNGRKVRIWKHREIGGRIKSGNFAQDARGRWYCNLVCEVAIRPHGKNEAVGIDLGLKEGMTLSTGKKAENSRVFAKYEDDLATAQRANKARRVQAIHAKIVNTRKDFLHKETTKIADTFRLVCVGDISGCWLQATNGKSSADASTGMSRNMLRYKAIARGATFVDGIAGLEITEWECDACGSIHDRDVNAARNHLRLRRQTLAEGSSTLSTQR